MYLHPTPSFQSRRNNLANDLPVPIVFCFRPDDLCEWTMPRTAKSVQRAVDGSTFETFRYLSLRQQYSARSSAVPTWTLTLTTGPFGMPPVLL